MMASLFLLPSTASAQDDEVVVRIGLHAAEKNLNPFISPRALPITHDFTMLVYDTLFWSQATLDPEPWLATGAEASDDLTTWTISLRDGVTWHDGVPLTADDVAFTFEYFTSTGGIGRYGHHVVDHPTFLSAEVIDPLTVALTFEDAIGTFEMLPGGDIPIIPKHVWEGIEDPTEDATSLMIGSGPYRMTDYVPDTSYRLEANEDYFLGAPLVDTLVLNVIPDAQAAFAGLQTGELDFVTRNLPAPLHGPVNENPDLEIVDGSRMQSLYLMFNTRKPNLNATVRKAMSLAIDVEQIVEIVEGGLGVPGNDTWTHPQSEFAHPTGGHAYDPAAAAAMLDEAGYVAGDGGTRVSPDGEPLAFTLLVNAAAPPQLRAGELVAEQLDSLGVDITVEPLDAPAIGAARRPSPDSPPTNDMFIAVFESHAHADPDHLYFFFHTPGAGKGFGQVFSGYSNTEFDTLVEDALNLKPEEKIELLTQAQDIFAEEAPAVTLSYPNGRWAYRPAAYSGWLDDPGHGVFTKRSFLEGYANVAEPDPVEEEVEEPAEEPEEAAVEEPEAEEDEPVATTAAPADDSTVDVGDDDDDGGFPWLPVGIGAGVLALGGAALLGGRGKKDGATVTRDTDRDNKSKKIED